MMIKIAKLDNSMHSDKSLISFVESFSNAPFNVRKVIHEDQGDMFLLHDEDKKYAFICGHADGNTFYIDKISVNYGSLNEVKEGDVYFHRLISEFLADKCRYNVYFMTDNHTDKYIITELETQKFKKLGAAMVRGMIPSDEVHD